MSDDKMRAEFEKWAGSKCMSLTRINWDDGTVSEYAYTATFDAWRVWQAAYQAGQKAEREAIFIEREDGEVMAAEVERLRAELAAANTRTHAEKQNRSVEVNGAVRHVDEAMEAAAGFRAEMKVRPYWTLFSETVAVALAAEVERLRAELAAAKAASVVPVQVVSCDPDYEQTATVVLWSNADAQRFADWLRDRMKDNSPPAT